MKEISEENLSLSSIYEIHLKNIGGFLFTRREIDIIAYLSTGKSSGTISSFLHTSPRTVETHIYNIKKKLDFNSREHIIDFIEKNNKFSFLRKYYENLYIHNLFVKSLKNILKKEVLESLSIIYNPSNKDHINVYKTVLEYLKILNIKFFLKEDNYVNYMTIKFEKNIDSEDFYTLNIIFNYALENYNQIKNQINKEKTIFFIFDENKILLENEYDVDSKFIFWKKNEDFYCILFEIIRIIFPKNNVFIDNIKEEIKRNKSLLSDNSFLTNDNLINYNKKSFLEKIKNKYNINYLKKIIILVICVVFFIFKESFNSYFHIFNNQESIKIDLPIISDNILLKRTHLIRKIEDSFQNQDGIKSLALVGIGGSGKTTLARQYVIKQYTNVLWEINCETPETLLNSFESFAYSLAKTNEDKYVLKELENIKNSEEKRIKIIFFVEKKLKELQPWILVYDNVNSFSEIQNSFPMDPSIWGKGKIIITTRDKNIDNNNFLKHKIFLEVLNKKQKLDLFLKIFKYTNFSLNFPLSETKKFLENLPPYPLDILTAAYYIISNHSTYTDYVKNIMKQEENFLISQENLLKDINGYKKIRYNIIALSLDEIIKKNKRFLDFLLLISIIDSQNIPVNILKRYNGILAEHFIYNLKQYSLINDDPSTPQNPLYSLHRSTQKIFYIYLVKKFNLLNDTKCITILVNKLEEYVKELRDNENFTELKFLTSHLNKFLTHDILLNEINRAILKKILGSIYSDLSYNVKAKEMLTESLLTLKKNTQDYVRIAEILLCLGCVLRELGDDLQSKIYFEDCLDIYKKYSPEKEIEIAWVSTYLGNTYRNLGKYKQAKKILKQSLAFYRSNFKKNSSQICCILSYLGVVYKDLGLYEKAEYYLKEGYLNYKKLLGDEHPSVAWAYMQLGILYAEFGNYSKAKEILDQSYKVYLLDTVDNDPGVISTKIQLGLVYLNLGLIEQAKKFLAKSLEECEKAFGKNSIRTAIALNTLGKVYLFENNLEKADIFFQRSYKIFSDLQHPKIYIVLESLAEMYFKKSILCKKNFSKDVIDDYRHKAILYIEQALEIVKNHFSEKSFHYARMKSKIKLYEEK